MRIGNYSEFLTNLKQGINRMLFLHDIFDKESKSRIVKRREGGSGGSTVKFWALIIVRMTKNQNQLFFLFGGHDRWGQGALQGHEARRGVGEGVRTIILIRDTQ